MSDDRIVIGYRLTLAEGETAEEKARDIALEQTVELPEGRYPSHVAERVVGRVQSVAPTRAGVWEATISYDPGLVGSEVLSLLNLAFGNVSMKRGIRVTDVELPGALLERLPGPAFGIAGIRDLTGVRNGRPLVCAAAKPVGLSSDELADVCRRFAAAGVDIVKDDHSLSDQTWAPFEDRVRRCQEAVSESNARTGGCTLYFPNLLCAPGKVNERLDVVQGAGCRGVIVAPLAVGIATMHEIAARDMAVLAHPMLSGAFFDPVHGIAPEILYGVIFRLAGADGVIYPNAGGRFPISEDTCTAINERLRRPMGPIERSFPVAGGGVDVERVAYWVERYGRDTILLIGSSFYARQDMVSASRSVVERVKTYADA